MALPLEKNLSLQNEPHPGKVRGRSSLNNDYEYLNESRGATAANDATYGQSSKETVDQIYSKEAFQSNVLGPVGIGRQKRRGVKRNEEGEETNTRSVPSFSKTVQRRLAANSALSPARLLLKARASAVNVSSLSWQIPLWLFLQLPFALISIVALGVVISVDILAAPEGGILAWLTSKALKIADTIAKLIGIDFSQIALGLFSAFTMFILAIGLFSMLFMSLYYLMNGMRPLSGNGAGLKIGMFLLAIVGYSTPLLNLFPFIVLWMMAVWWYPR